MMNALKGGWETPKKIGYFTAQIFQAIEEYRDINKHIFVLAHGEDIILPDNRIYTKFKTVGKMVDEYITPEGKFDITLIGVSRYDATKRQVIKEFATNETEYNSAPKSPYGMFQDLYIPNDLGYVVQQINKYYHKN